MKCLFHQPGFGWISWGKNSRLSQLPLWEIVGVLLSVASLFFDQKICFTSFEVVSFFKVAKIISSWWFQLLWKLWRAPSKWVKIFPNFRGENSKNVWSFATQIFMQFLPMAFGPLAIHLYRVCSLPLEVRMMCLGTTVEMTRTTGNVRLLHCIQMENHRQSQVKNNKDLHLKSNTCFEYKEICRLKKYREIYRTFSTKTLNWAMHKPQTQPISSDFKEAW